MLWLKEALRLSGLIISTLVYFIGLWLGKRLLNDYDLEFKPISKFVVLNTFAITLALIATIPFK